MTKGDLDGDGASETILLAGSEDDTGNGFLYVVRGRPEYAVTRIPFELTVGIPRVHIPGS